MERISLCITASVRDIGRRGGRSCPELMKSNERGKRRSDQNGEQKENQLKARDCKERTGGEREWEKTRKRRKTGSGREEKRRGEKRRERCPGTTEGGNSSDGSGVSTDTIHMRRQSIHDDVQSFLTTTRENRSLPLSPFSKSSSRT